MITPEFSISYSPLAEGSMQYSPSTPSNPPFPAERRPFLASFDSGHECSLDHWLEVSWLVEHEEDELDGYVFEDCLVTR
jgi:hypothetical protein